MQEIYEDRWMSECGEWEVDVRGKVLLYYLGENIPIKITNTPDEVDEFIQQFNEREWGH